MNADEASSLYNAIQALPVAIAEEFARRPDLAFIVRPHPLFFAVMDDRGILSAAQKENFQRSCASAGNILIDRRPDYEPVFAAAAAIRSS